MRLWLEICLLLEMFLIKRQLRHFGKIKCLVLPPHKHVARELIYLYLS
jgi:hypothetical protein